MHLARSPLNQPLNTPSSALEAAQRQKVLEDLGGLGDEIGIEQIGHQPRRDWHADHSPIARSTSTATPISDLPGQRCREPARPHTLRPLDEFLAERVPDVRTARHRPASRAASWHRAGAGNRPRTCSLIWPGRADNRMIRSASVSASPRSWVTNSTVWLLALPDLEQHLMHVESWCGCRARRTAHPSAGSAAR